jgi:hypothetical protein
MQGFKDWVAVNEAEYQGKAVTLNPNLSIKTSDPERKKNFRARHGCDAASDPTTPKYWSCKMWSTDSVEDIL